MIDLSHPKFLSNLNAVYPTLGLTLSNVAISQPRVNDETWTGPETGNTLIRLTPIGSSRFGDSKVISYDRITLAELGGLVNNRLPVPVEYSTKEELISCLLFSYGFTINPADIESAVLHRDADPELSTVTLTASANSISVTGTHVFKAIPGVSDLSSVVTITNLNGFKYINDIELTDAGMYSSTIDFTRFVDVLSAVTAQSDLAPICNILTASAGDIWSMEPGHHSLSGATFVSNDASAVVGYDHALVIQLSSDCTALNGQLILNYRDTYTPLNPGIIQ